jgi:hypothetical protein
MGRQLTLRCHSRADRAASVTELCSPPPSSRPSSAGILDGHACQHPKVHLPDAPWSMQSCTQDLFEAPSALASQTLAVPLRLPEVECPRLSMLKLALGLDDARSPVVTRAELVHSLALRNPPPCSFGCSRSCAAGRPVIRAKGGRSKGPQRAALPRLLGEKLFGVHALRVDDDALRLLRADHLFRHLRHTVEQWVSAGRREEKEKFTRSTGTWFVGALLVSGSGCAAWRYLA